jgi:hypothetical protein
MTGEHETTEPTWPPPARDEVERAGGQQLPGFDELPEQSQEGRKPWTA